MQPRPPPERPSPKPQRISVSPTTVLTEEVDIHERIRDATSRDLLKGMFFHRIIELARRAQVTHEAAGIERPVPGDKYLAFTDYPMADYLRWVAAIGRAMYPRFASSEAMRRVAADDFGAFASSRLGSITLAFTGGAKATLAKSGMLYSQVLKGPTVESEATSEGVTIRYRSYPGPVEYYPIGTIEGTCRHYDADYLIEVDVLGPNAADYFVRVAS